MGPFFVALILGIYILGRLGYEKIAIRASEIQSKKAMKEREANAPPPKPAVPFRIKEDGSYYNYTTRKFREEIMGTLQMYPPYEVKVSQQEDCRYYFDEEQAMHIVKPGECEIHEVYYGYRKKQAEAIDYKLLQNGDLSKEKVYMQLKECLRDIEYKRREYVHKQGGHVNVVRR